LKILIKNIRGLAGVVDAADNRKMLRGNELSEYHIIQDAWLAIEDGKIADFGTMANWPGISDWRDLEVIDAEGRFVFPAWCDSHTHLVWAGSREVEFEDRLRGLSYEEIAKRGGGILNSVEKLRSADAAQLIEASLERAYEIIASGTGAVEIKSGYGLDLDSELKMLRVAGEIGQQTPLTIKRTFLGAHALPPEYKNDKQGYIKLLVEQMIPRIAGEGLAEYIDAFCERNYFDEKDLSVILEAGVRYGLKPKIHVNQFSVSGGVSVALNYDAVSVDHLEILGEGEAEAIAATDTIATALPLCSLFLGIPYTPARALLNAGAALAIATDFNPGSAPSGNMNLAVSLACIQMKMLPAEAFNAAARNGAAAMELHDTHGSIRIGNQANAFITKPMPSAAFLPYYFGINPVERLILNGQII
jgi:imidazolonepropionase